MIRVFYIALALCAAPLVSTAGTDVIALPSGYAEEDVGGAIWKAVTCRGWSVNTHSNGFLECSLEHRGLVSSLSIRYGANVVEIDDTTRRLATLGNVARSSRPGFSPPNKTKRVAIPEKWLRNIRADLVKNLSSKDRGAYKEPRSSAPVSDIELMEKLADLKSFYEQGLITESVYNLKQLELINSLK